MDRSRANLEEYERVLRLAAARQREAAGGDYSVGAPPLSRVSADVLLNLERRSEELSRRARHFSSVGTSDPASAGPPTRVLRDRPTIVPSPAAPGSAPVSYTHLTLPTNREV